MFKQLMKIGVICLALMFAACGNDNPVVPDYQDVDLGPAFFSSELTKIVDKINPPTQENGGRGTNELIVYTNLYGNKTNTNAYGVEAIVENGVVVRVGGNNSAIPSVGFVISGHGDAAVWINNHIQIGSEVSLSGIQIVVVDSENSVVEHARNFMNKGKKRLEAISHPSIEETDLNLLETNFNNSLEAFIKAKQDNDSTSVKELARITLSKARDYYYYTFPSIAGDERAAWLEIQGMSKQELENVFIDLAEMGFNTVCPEVIYRGWSIFPNSPNGLEQYPDFIGRDPMQEMMDLGEKYDIKIVPWVWVFFVGSNHFNALIEAKPEWLAISRKGKYPSEVEAGFYYFCPSRDEVREYWLQIYAYMIDKYNLKSLQLDYIRYPGEPWTNDYCYCSECRSKFQTENGINPKDINPTDDPEMWAKWDEFRENNVNRFVEAVSNKFPQVDISADVFPDQEYSLRVKKQNWSKWLDNDWLNTVYIMAYTSDVDLVRDLIDYMAGRMKDTQRGIAGLGPYTGMKPEILLEEIETARTKEIDGTCLFIYNALNEEQKDALKKGPYRLK